MTERLDYIQHSPDLFQKVMELSDTSRSTDLDPKLRHLVDIRASQLNGCAFCVDMHVKEAKIDGESELRLYHVAIWWESPLFSERERAALAWTEVVTRLPADGIPDAAYDRVRAHFSDKEVSDLTFAIMTINAWNRLSVAFRRVPGSADKFLGLDKAGLS
ncbi:MAG: carboxymuconolactone decarboxylase family protein [Alphaproteobacteria bacterium]|nr:carboxymuconolactone decarboxylase family protein [Alphaproteobacteria bacterium]